MELIELWDNLDLIKFGDRVKLLVQTALVFRCLRAIAREHFPTESVSSGEHNIRIIAGGIVKTLVKDRDLAPRKELRKLYNCLQKGSLHFCFMAN